MIYVNTTESLNGASGVSSGLEQLWYGTNVNYSFDPLLTCMTSCLILVWRIVGEEAKRQRN